MYVKSLDLLEGVLKKQLTRYRECFPFATPRGSIEASLKMLMMIYQDPLYFRKFHFISLFLFSLSFFQHEVDRYPIFFEGKNLILK